MRRKTYRELRCGFRDVNGAVCDVPCSGRVEGLQDNHWKPFCRFCERDIRAEHAAGNESIPLREGRPQRVSTQLTQEDATRQLKLFE